eukprot:TRINITY_DN3889_c0_g1_i3.p1 TRINITY_DN3889_c0_g1~~TRINITY_DN3889_c0_g1_i3.p1  ORF type:complete len:1460 (+),score=297.90 TRINITY_DN3889_c0_g1_i3:131-4381(+)
MEGVVLPVVLWNGAPSHDISAMLVTSDRSALITGASNGNICIWALNLEKTKEACLAPRIFCLGHTSAITCLGEASFSSHDVIVSGSADGSVHVWSMNDGTCLHAGPYMLGGASACAMTTLPDRRYVAIAGESCDIYIVDLYTMDIIHELRGHTDWVTSLFAFDIGKESPYLMSSGRDGTVRYWSLKDSETDFPLQTLPLPEGVGGTDGTSHVTHYHTGTDRGGIPIMVAIAPDLLTFIVVTQRVVSLFIASTSRLLWSAVCPFGYPQGWGGGAYVDKRKILMFTTNGQGCIYRLKLPKGETVTPLSFMGTSSARSHYSPATPSPLLNSSGGIIVSPSLTSTPIRLQNNLLAQSGGFPLRPLDSGYNSPFFDLNIENLDTNTLPPIVICTFNEGHASQQQTTLSPFPNLDSSPPHQNGTPLVNPSPINLNNSNTNNTNNNMPISSNNNNNSYNTLASSGCFGNIFVVGSSEGKVDLWVLQGWESPLTAEPPPHTSTYCSDAWKDIYSPDSSAKGPIGVVTSSIIVQDIMALVRGYDNGSLAIYSLPTAPFPRTVQNAHNGRVNCLLCSTPNYSSQKRLLISGSSDFTIKVWDVASFDLVHVFSNHSGPVTHLFAPPPSYSSSKADSAFDNVFFSVSDDKCVGYFSLDSMRSKYIFGVHSSHASLVSLRREQDFLLVAGADGTVWVWLVATGELEGRIQGQASRDILENSEKIWRRESYSVHNTAVSSSSSTSAIIDDVALDSFTIQNMGDVPVQLMLFDLKQMCSELHKHVIPKKITPSTSLSGAQQQQQGPSPSRAPSSSNLNNSTSSSHANNSNGNTNTNSNAPSQPSPMSSSSPSALSSSVVSSATTGAPSSSSIVQPSSSMISSLATLPSYQCFSYLVPWGLDKACDVMVKKELMLRPPHPSFSFGTRGEGGNLGLLVPSAGALSRWQCSGEMTAIVSMAAVAIAKALLSISDQKNACSQVLAFYCAHVPELLRNTYVEPSLPVLASFWQDDNEDLMQAARSIFISTINRMPTGLRRTIAQGLSVQLWKPNKLSKSGTPTPTTTTGGAAAMAPASTTAADHPDGPPTNNKGDLSEHNKARENVVFVLAILGAEKPDSLDERVTQRITIELLKILYRGASPRLVTVVELIAKGFPVWRPHIKDLQRLLKLMFALSLQNEPMASAAHGALMTMGGNEPVQFVATLGAEIARDQVTVPSSSAVMTIGSLVKRDPVALLPLLPRLVETVVRSVDPHTPTLRDSCIKATTAVLHTMVSKYPMVSFHTDSQRLAVGTAECSVIIYDLKTATRWHVLEGHKGPITAVAFSDSGRALASYSMAEGLVRIWNAHTSFLSGVFGGQPHCVRQFSLPKSAASSPQVASFPPSSSAKSSPQKLNSPDVPPNVLLETVKLQWASPSSIMLVRGWEGSITLNLDVAL